MMSRDSNSAISRAITVSTCGVKQCPMVCP
jgi:hypothetical protein